MKSRFKIVFKNYTKTKNEFTAHYLDGSMLLGKLKNVMNGRTGAGMGRSLLCKDHYFSFWPRDNPYDKEI